MKYNSGFTLIELLVVISIIGYLSTVTFSSIASTRARARDIKRIEDMEQVLHALEIYNNEHGRYPCHESETSNGWDQQILKILFDEEYVSQPLRDPLNHDRFIYWYNSYKEVDGGPCGQFVELNVDFEWPQSQCPFGGRILAGGLHCHIMYPHPMLPPCMDPFTLLSG